MQIEISPEEYLVDVLAGEIFYSYETEALKAQAVASRSFILSRVAEYMEGNVHESHK